MMNENKTSFAGMHLSPSNALSITILNTGLHGTDCPEESELSAGQRRVIALVSRSGLRVVLERRAVEGEEPSWMIVAYFDGKQMEQSRLNLVKIATPSERDFAD